MNIWEDVYNKNKGIEKVPVYPQSNRNQFPDRQEEHEHVYEIHQRMPSDTCSPENVYHRINRPQSAEHIDPKQGMKQAGSKSKASRFSPKILSDRISTPYPAILSKIKYQFTDIWANIQVEAKKDVETLLVCGATRKEGNTFISFHLAMFLSKEYNMNVLYMDTNPNPNHSVLSKTKNLPGLFSFISENKNLSTLIIKTEYPGLYILPFGAGTSTINTSGLFPRESIDTLFDYCRNNFSVTIIDGQPLTMSPAMIDLAKKVDMTAIVCRYGYSRHEVTKLAIDKLQKFGVTSIGVILNDRQFPIPQTIYKLMG